MPALTSASIQRIIDDAQITLNDKSLSKRTQGFCCRFIVRAEMLRGTMLRHEMAVRQAALRNDASEQLRLPGIETEPTATQASAEPWRDEVFSAYIDTKKTLNALSNAKLETIGAMQDYLDGGGTLGQIDGLNQKAFSEILAAIDAAKKLEPATA